MGIEAARGNSVIPMTPAADHSAKRGYFVKNSGGSAAVTDGVTDEAIGVIIDGETTTGKDSIQLIAGGTPPVKVKLGAAATAFGYGTLHATDGTVCDDPTSGGRRIVCLFLESGVTDELVDAICFKPVAAS